MAIVSTNLSIVSNELASPRSIAADANFLSPAIQYVRIPFYHGAVNGHASQGATNPVRFDGFLDVFESGAVRFIGTFYQSNQQDSGQYAIPYRIWIGSSTSVGAYYTVASPTYLAPVTGTFLYKPGAGEQVYFVFGCMQTKTNTPAASKVLITEFPAGLKTALDFPISYGAYPTYDLTTDGAARVNNIVISKTGDQLTIVTTWLDYTASGGNRPLAVFHSYRSRNDTYKTLLGATYGFRLHAYAYSYVDPQVYTSTELLEQDPNGGLIMQVSQTVSGYNTIASCAWLGYFNNYTYPIYREVI